MYVVGCSYCQKHTCSATTDLSFSVGLLVLLECSCQVHFNFTSCQVHFDFNNIVCIATIDNTMPSTHSHVHQPQTFSSFVVLLESECQVHFNFNNVVCSTMYSHIIVDALQEGQ